MKYLILVLIAFSFASCGSNTTCCLNLTTPFAVGIDSLPWDIEHDVEVTEDSVQYEFFFDGPVVCSDFDDIESEFDLLFYWVGNGAADNKKCLVDKHGNKAKFNFVLGIGETKVIRFPDGLYHPNHMNEKTWIWDNMCQYKYINILMKQKSACYYEESSITTIIHPDAIGETLCTTTAYQYDDFLIFDWLRLGFVSDNTNCPVNLSEKEEEMLKEHTRTQILHKNAIDHWNSVSKEEQNIIEYWDKSPIPTRL